MGRFCGIGEASIEARGGGPTALLANGAIIRLPYPPFDVLVAEVDGKICAIEDACNHAGASLSEGDRSGREISCPMHGYIFDLETGRLLEPKELCDDQRKFVVETIDGEAIVYDPFVLTIG